MRQAQARRTGARGEEGLAGPLQDFGVHAGAVVPNRDHRPIALLAETQTYRASTGLNGVQDQGLRHRLEAGRIESRPDGVGRRFDHQIDIGVGRLQPPFLGAQKTLFAALRSTNVEFMASHPEILPAGVRADDEFAITFIASHMAGASIAAFAHWIEEGDDDIERAIELFRALAPRHMAPLWNRTD